MKKTDKKENPKVVENPSADSAKAIMKYVRISPRKVRLVTDTIRHRNVQEAFPILYSLKKKAARLVEKLLRSAVANAKVLGMNEKRLYVSKIYADGGPTLKRFMSRSMGRADRILKRTTHLCICLSEGKKEWTGSVELIGKEAHKDLPKTEKEKAKSEKDKKKAAAASR